VQRKESTLCVTSAPAVSHEWVFTLWFDFIEFVPDHPPGLHDDIGRRADEIWGQNIFHGVVEPTDGVPRSPICMRRRQHRVHNHSHYLQNAQTYPGGDYHLSETSGTDLGGKAPAISQLASVSIRLMSMASSGTSAIGTPWTVNCFQHSLLPESF